MILIIASHHTQAVLAARQLGLYPDEWKFVTSTSDLFGYDHKTRVIEALPQLDSVSSRYPLLTEADRRGMTIEEVRT